MSNPNHELELAYLDEIILGSKDSDLDQLNAKRLARFFSLGFQFLRGSPIQHENGKVISLFGNKGFDGLLAKYSDINGVRSFDGAHTTGLKIENGKIPQAYNFNYDSNGSKGPIISPLGGIVLLTRGDGGLYGVTMDELVRTAGVFPAKTPTDVKQQAQERLYNALRYVKIAGYGIKEGQSAASLHRDLVSFFGR